MRRRLGFAAGLAALWLAAAPPAAQAGAINSCFAPGALGVCSERVLEHVAFKSVILQFLDPQQTGLGEGLSRLLWREVLESISDLAGAGVILAHDREGALREALAGRDYLELLEGAYHEAARQIAEQLEAQISVWGVVLPDGVLRDGKASGGEGLFVQSFLTLRSDAEAPWLLLGTGNRAAADLRLSAPIGRERINLPPLRSSLEALVGRRFTTRCALAAGCPRGVPLRQGPANDSPLAGHLGEGATVEGRAMTGPWIEVAGPGGAPAFINLYHLEVFPERVTFRGRSDVNLRAGPAGTARAKVDLDGDYAVLEAQRAPGGEPWYRIRAGEREGWVAGRLVARRSYSFPAVHLIAGLYRYGRGQFARAVAEFESFLAVAPDLDNVTAATTRQFLAASRLASRDAEPPLVEAALDDLTAAAALTPYDPAAYTLRALVRLGGGYEAEAGLDDLAAALRLDHSDPRALQLLRELEAVRLFHGSLGVLSPFPDPAPGPADAQLEALRLRYLEPAERR